MGLVQSTQPDRHSPPDIWPNSGSSRIPARAYTDPDIYQRELDRIFYGPHWNHVGLEAEVPDTGSFNRKIVWRAIYPVWMRLRCARQPTRIEIVAGSDYEDV